jgi:hypothetical protein
MFAACNPFHQSVRMSQDVNYGQRWHGTLTSPGYLAGAVQIHGTASMAPDSDGRRTTVRVTVTNAAPGGMHPWEARQGQCGTDRGVFGPLDQYRPIEVGNDGKGEAEATIPMATPTNGDSFVLLHASETNRATIIACGNLAPPAP